MLASLSEGVTRIKNLLMGDDCLRTIEAFRAMGVKIKPLSLTLSPKGRGKGEGRFPAVDIIVRGVGMRGLKKPSRALYLGNSGTTMRILPGILAGQDFQVTLKGDRSLSKRPMKRIAEPLRRMGAEIASAPTAHRNDVIARSKATKQSLEIHSPLQIHGGRLKPLKYRSNIASAQVKSCILLAGLFAKGVTSVLEPVRSRDHTERMLNQFGVRCSEYGVSCEVKGPAELKSPGTIEIPGDISSAAFFIVAGCILPDTKVILKKVGLNPTRTGILDILKRMKADISLQPAASNLEPYGDIIVKSSKLKGVTIYPKEVVRAIDEIPIIMVAACLAKGKTVIRGVGELRVKETDRIKSMVTNLRKLGADIKPLSLTLSPKGRRKGEGVIINGGRPLRGARVSSFGDNRTAMSMLIAGLITKGKVTVTGLSCINKSFPGFGQSLHKLH